MLGGEVEGGDVCGGGFGGIFSSIIFRFGVAFRAYGMA